MQVMIDKIKPMLNKSNQALSLPEDSHIGFAVVMDFCPKEYITYKYLGISIDDFLRNKPRSNIEENYILAIKLTLALHHLHSGKQSLTGKQYIHRDIHNNNVLIDTKGQPNIIDFGRSWASYDTQEISNDIYNILLLLFVPSYLRNQYPQNTVFGVFGDYQVRYRKPDYEDDNGNILAENGTIQPTFRTGFHE